MGGRIVEIKAEMFDLNQKAESYQRQFTGAVQPLRDKFNELAKELQAEEEREKKAKVQKVKEEESKVNDAK